MAMIEVKNLKKYFDIGPGQKVHAVDDISIEIEEKEIIGLVGESGSGKSTFGRTLCGLWDKTEGEVYYKGEKLPTEYGPKDFKKFSKKIQMIFQDPYSSLNPRMTVKEIIGEGIKLQGNISDKELTKRVGDWLSRVGLQPDHMSRYPHEFSGGQRQRIGIARALIVEPDFVVCDEPISALDVSVQAQVVNLLEDIKNSLGLTLLFIAHDLSMVRYVSDRMAVMYLGSMVELGPTNEVYFRSKHPYTQLLVESNPEPDPEIERNRASVGIKGEIPSPINIGEGCRFAGRCPHATDKCHKVTPIWKEVAPKHFTACHLYD
jgi:oligopeptide/dipeptide ABC transporter ATP-binding protein